MLVLTMKTKDYIRLTFKNGQTIDVYINRVKGKHEVRLGFEGHKDIKVDLIKGEINAIAK